MTPLNAFLQNSSVLTTMTVAGNYYLPVNGADSNTVLSGAYMPMTCISGYTYASGQLNITCTGNTWSTFPRCISSTNGGSVQSPVPSATSGLPCIVDQATSFNITNGYYSSSSLLYTANNTSATGYIQFSCVPGYVIDQTIGTTYTCNNGVWSTKPRCISTGRCSYPTLQSYITTATGLQTTNITHLVAASQNDTVVFNGSYIVLACATGYTNIGGNLNITCSDSGSWSPFPICVLNGGSASLTTTTISGNNAAVTTTTTPSSGGAACPYDPTTLFALTNGYFTSSSLSNPTPTTANGWIQFACNPGYALDPTVGASYTCNNGVWSTKPRCLITPRCSMDVFNKFLSSSTAIQTTSQMKLSATPQDQTVVFVDSYAVVACATGYTNTGGSLNVTCLSTGSWSAFPNCVINGGSGSLTTTTISAGNAATTTTISAGNGGVTITTTAAGNPAVTTTTTPSSGGAACPYDPTTIFALTNGYYISSSLSNPTPTTANGWIQFACNPGYALDPTVGASYTCNNGVWSTKPRCLITPRCSMDTLNKFLSSSTAIQTTSQMKLSATPQDTTVVFVDSYAVVACATGYTNTGGSLNVTCLSTGSWSPFPNCVINGGSGSLTTTTISAGNGAATTTTISAGNGGVTTTTTAAGNPALTTTTTPSSGGAACPYDPTTLFALTNGYYISSSISNPTPTTAAGWIQFACNPGYALDPIVGASHTCNNGVWSTKPRCLITPRCSMDTLNKFLSSSTAIQTTSQMKLSATPQDTTVVFVDSYAVVACATGYTNTGGSLNVTCLSTGSWSAFPNCVINGGSGSLTTTTISAGNGGITTTTTAPGSPALTTTTTPSSGGAACPYDPTTLFALTNGYYISSSISNPTPTTATGWIQFTCNPGYALDPTVGASYTCNNGVWSTKPRCLITPRCSMDTLNKFLSSPTIQTTTQIQLRASPQDTTVVFVDSYAVVACAAGYMNTGGNLNVTCLSTGSWSPFPNCVINGGSGSLTTTTISAGNGGITTTTTAPGNPALTTTTTPSSGGAACPYDPTTIFALTNGYYTSSSISNPTPTTAAGWIQFTCNPGYALDPTVGASYTCNNGIWSTKPRCLITPRCSMDTLNKFLSSPTIQTTTQIQLRASPQDTTVVFVDSYIVVSCAVGYTNTGGSLNITCLSTGAWSAFPNCVLTDVIPQQSYNSGGSATTIMTSTTNGPVITTTTSVANGLACMIDAATFTITSGYYLTSSLSNPSPGTATGWIQFTCNPGYALDPTVGASYTCNNGVWSTKPRCLITPRCSMDTLNKFLSSPTIQTTNQTQLRASPQDQTIVFVDSYIVVTCAAGYMNTGGSLNVTCLSTGSWSPFPTCVINGGSGSLTTTTISTGNSAATTTTTTPSSGGTACPVDLLSIFILTNGYYTINGLSFKSITSATGSVQFACNPG
ncbi:unnamed protein product, partial [Adineta steineri]